MYTRQRILSLLFWLAAPLLFAGDSDLRTWTSGGGAHTIKAEYLGKKGKDKVYLLKENDRLLTVRLDALSQEDRAYVAEAENPDNLPGDDTKPSKSVYAKGRQRAEQLFEEIEEWKEDGDFRSVGFDPVGPFFRWQLQAKKLEKTLNAEPGSSDGETNLGALSAAVAELIKLGDEYAENEGNVTKRTRKASAYIEDVLDSLTDEPDGEPSRLMASDGMAEEDEPNPFEEEGSAPSKTRKKAGPKSRKPQVDESDEENPAKYTTDRKSRRNSGGLIPLLGSLTEQDDGEVSHDESSVITYDQFKQVKMGMTKEEVFEVLGKGVKVSMPIVDALVGMRLEAYLWENEDEFGGCEITFADGKVEHKIWNGPVPQDEEEDEDMSEKKSGRKTDKK